MTDIYVEPWWPQSDEEFRLAFLQLLSLTPALSGDIKVRMGEVLSNHRARTEIKGLMEAQLIEVEQTLFELITASGDLEDGQVRHRIRRAVHVIANYSKNLIAIGQIP